MSAVKYPPTDIYPEVFSHCLRIWQAEWHECISTKLHCLKPLLGYNNLSGLSRQDAVILRRLRIGHTHLTHSYHLNGQDAVLDIVVKFKEFKIKFVKVYKSS